jgi:hypothetical protein
MPHHRLAHSADADDPDMLFSVLSHLRFPKSDVVQTRKAGSRRNDRRLPIRLPITPIVMPINGHADTALPTMGRANILAANAQSIPAHEKAGT